MEQGDLSQRVRVDSRDEIGQLAHAFNAMADGLARTDQLRRAMVTDVAHELRTPLTNLRGYLEAVRDGVTEPRPEVIDSLYEEAMLLSHLVDDLQDLTLSEAGQLTLRREPVALEGVLAAAAQAMQPRAQDKGVEHRRRDRIGIAAGRRRPTARWPGRAQPARECADAHACGRRHSPGCVARWRCGDHRSSGTPAPASSPSTCLTCSSGSTAATHRARARLAGRVLVWPWSNNWSRPTAGRWR